MCGITACIGNNSQEIVFNGLKQLQNRGYDSAGICYIKNDEFICNKFASTATESAINRLEKYVTKSEGVCIGHTRWATHGAKTDENAHPHIDMNNRFSLVHNGIIENYKHLKDFLIENGFKFKSQTDTEVIVNLISYHYNTLQDSYKSIKTAIDMLEGTYALAIICEANKLYFVRKGSPLLVSINENMAIVTSEQSGFCNLMNNYISLENNDLCVIEMSNNKLTMKSNNSYKTKNITLQDVKSSPSPYPHWTIKEIHEQPEAVLRSLSMGGRILSKDHCKLGGLEEYSDELLKIEHLILLGCGTSYHAGLTASSVFKNICNFNTVSVYDGGAFSDADLPKNSDKIGIIYLSQSGETKDLHRCLETVRNRNVINIGVINVVDSLIAREVDCGVYLNAGHEVAVASTKAFTCQVVVLNLIAVWFAQKKNIHMMERVHILSNLKQLSIQLDSVLDSVKEVCEKVSEYLMNHNTLFILGKGENEYVAYEGALKIKEIGYIHAQGYNSASLKHGTYSLIEKGTPVIIVNPNDTHHVRNQGIVEELKSRHAFVIGISDAELDDRYDMTIKVPENKDLNSLLNIVPLQLTAYYLACKKGHNPDYPRNLAKVVTVD
jgi:glucosamine--fructose-6-phosphate aminotransferase (isomerizing)